MEPFAQRLAAEALALPRTPFDPFRALAAADAAGIAVGPEEAAVLGDLLELLEDDARVALLVGEREARERLSAMIVADAWIAGSRRLLWVGALPRAVDRMATRCALPLREVRPERGAYDGEGLFHVPDLSEAPPGLGRVAPFDRIVAAAVDRDPPWSGPTLWHGELAPLAALAARFGAVERASLPALTRLAPALERPAPQVVQPPTTDAARAVDEVLTEPLLTLRPDPLADLARRAARGSHAARAAVLRRLETRLGRIARAARAGRTDDGIETGHQLSSDLGESLEGAIEEALATTEAEVPPPADAEAEAARLRSLREALEATPDPAVEALIERANAATSAGRGVLIRVASPAVRGVLEEALDTETGELDERLTRAAERPATAVVLDAEAAEARLDRAATEGLLVLRLGDGGPSLDCDLVVGPEAGPASPAAPIPMFLRRSRRSVALDRSTYDLWREHLGLISPPSHPETIERLRAALEEPAPGVTVHRLVGAAGARLVVVGAVADAPVPLWPTLEEGRFGEGLALLDEERTRLDRRLAGARRARAEALAELGERRARAEAAIDDQRRRRERALGGDERREAEAALEEAALALEPLADEERRIERRYEEARSEALARFARPPRLERSDDPRRTPSHPRGRLVP